MAQAGFTPISLYFSSTAAATPSAGNLVAGELALNTVDEKLYFKNSAGTVKLLASNATSAPVLSFQTSLSGLTPSTATTGVVTLAGTLGVASGGTGITAFGTGVATALGVNVGSAGAFVVNGGALGTPSSGTVTNLTGTASININGTVGATTANTGAFTTLSTSGAITVNTTALVSSGTNNIGINTASPLTNGATYGTLTINGSNGGAIQFATAGVSIAQVYNDGNALFINPATGKTLSLQIAGSTVASVSSTGLAVTGALSASTTIRTSDGLVGTPTFSFTNETSTGLYRSSNGAMSVAILGSEIARVTATGLLLNSNSNTTASIIAGGLNSNNGIIQFGSSGVVYSILGGAYQGNMNLFTGAGGGPIIFTPNNAERARITTGLSVGTTSDPGVGAIYATGNITAFFSDNRLKTVSGKIENALDKVAKLSGVYYTFNDTAKSFGYDSDEEQVGVIAQEVEAVLPQIVKAAPFDLDENNNSKSGENYKTVQYDKLVPLLIEAINELQAKVKALEAK